MKKVLTVVAMVAVCLFLLAGPVAAQSRATPEEVKFLTDGPKLYTMDAALEVSKATGKPVVCWVGKHLFADARARTLSAELGETTVQAVMDADGTELDRTAPLRLKFSTNNYEGNQKVYYVPVAYMDRAGMGQKVLRLSRGGD